MMNTRIEELKQQAMVEVVDTCPYNGMPSVSTELDVDKFAELIVDAICDIVIECDESKRASMREPYSFIMRRIQEEFGVE
jgi:hypothetical protein